MNSLYMYSTVYCILRKDTLHLLFTCTCIYMYMFLHYIVLFTVLLKMKISFSSAALGSFDEEFEWDVEGSNETLKLRIK